jgi:hypothetical protein
MLNIQRARHQNRGRRIDDRTIRDLNLTDNFAIPIDLMAWLILKAF